MGKHFFQPVQISPAVGTQRAVAQRHDMSLLTPPKPAQTQQEAARWWPYLQRQSPESGRWCALYEEIASPPAEKAGIVVQMLRDNDLTQAQRKLDECRQALDGFAPGTPSSVSALAELAYLTALAYLQYRRGEAEEARNSLDRSVIAIECAIRNSPFLTPSAGRCYELQLHRARISRNQGEWDRMWQEVARGRAMVAGKAPLCAGSTGDIYIEDICRFYRSAKPLNEIERESLDNLSDAEFLRRQYEAHCLSATLVPSIVFDSVP